MRAFMINTLKVILIIQSAHIIAQTTEQNQLPKVWNLEQCIAYAKEQNIQINTLRLTTKSTEQDLLLSKAAKLPNLSEMLHKLSLTQKMPI